MAIVAPMFVTCEYGQDLSLPITIPTDTTGWTAEFDLYDYDGQVVPAVTKTTSAGITNTPGASSSTMTVALTAANLSIPPGLRSWTLRRTDSGSTYPIMDRSGWLVATSGPSAYPRLTNLANYLASLGLSETVADADAKQYLWALTAAESALKRACNRQFTYSASRTEYLSPNWTPAVGVKETPVESIASIYYDLGARGGQNSGDFASTTLLTLGDDYYLFRDRAGDTYSDSGLIYRVGGIWQGWQDRPVGLLGYRKVPAVNCLKATYAGGYGNAVRPPVDLVNAIHEAATLIRKAAREGRLAMSQSGEGESISLGPVENEVRRLASTAWGLSSYKRIVI